jgi:tetratricopeptide (TPR) repeat protein
MLIQDLPTVPLFLVMDHRPAFAPPWRARPCYSQVTLGELDEQAGLELASSMLALPALPEGLRQAILAKSQGNPLFIEEMVKSLVEAGSLARQGDQWVLAQPAAGVAIPDTIQGVILSRLDCLDEGSRHAAQVASVIGQRFRYLLLAGVYPQPDELPQRLASLSAVDLVVSEDHPTDPTYLFKHVLTQEVAYDSLLYARRREFHARIGACIERLYAERLDEQLEVLAMHTLRAEEWGRALDYHLRAGRKALALYANEDAVGFLSKALEIAGQCAGDTGAQKLEAHELLGDAQFNIARLDAALDSYEQSRHLWRQPAEGESRPAADLAALLRKMGIVHERKGDYPGAYRWFEEGLRLLEEVGAAGDTLEEARLCGAMAGTLYRQGRYGEARAWALRAQGTAERLHSERDTAHFYNLLGTIGWELGEPEQAIAYRQKSLSLYQGLGDLNGLAAAHNNLGIALFHFGRWSEAMPHLQQSLELRQKIGDSIGEATVLLNLGEALTGMGALDEAADSCRKALSMFNRIGYRWGAAVAKSNLGGVCTFLQRWAEAETLLMESRRDFEHIGSRSFLAEVDRRLAELAQEQGAWQDSRERATASLALALELNSRQEEGIARRVLARAEAALGETARARILLDESLGILQGLRNDYEKAKTLLEMTLLEGSSGEPETYLPSVHRQEAIEIFERLGARRDLELARTAFHGAPD